MDRKSIKEWLEERTVEYTTYKDKFIIDACEVGDNFYDYGDEPKPITFAEGYEWMEDNPLIIIRECCDCCSCSGW